MEKIKPAIVVVGYNRKECLLRLLNSLNNADYCVEDVTLIISLDYSEVTKSIVDEAKQVGWKHGNIDIRVNSPRLGLKKHILQCGELSFEYGAVIVLEDDLIVSKSFYNYAYETINHYSDDEKVCGIALYSHAWNGYSNYRFIPQKNMFDVYWGQFSITWGQCWTANQWCGFKEWLSKNEELKSTNYALPEEVENWGNNSWGKYFFNYIVEKNLFYVIPYYSQSTNFSEVGVHNSFIDSAHQVVLGDYGDNYEYKYPNYEQAVKYDAFFERILEGQCIDGIKYSDICFNLNNIHRTAMGKKYVLSMCREKNFKLIKSYGAQMKPIESNVMYNVEGNSIFLYEVGEAKIKYRRISYKRLFYELSGYPYIVLAKYAIYRIIQRICRR